MKRPRGEQRIAARPQPMRGAHSQGGRLEPNTGKQPARPAAAALAACFLFRSRRAETHARHRRAQRSRRGPGSTRCTIQQHEGPSRSSRRAGCGSGREARSARRRREARAPRDARGRRHQGSRRRRLGGCFRQVGPLWGAPKQARRGATASPDHHTARGGAARARTLTPRRKGVANSANDVAAHGHALYTAPRAAQASAGGGGSQASRRWPVSVHANLHTKRTSFLPASPHALVARDAHARAAADDDGTRTTGAESHRATRHRATTSPNATRSTARAPPASRLTIRAPPQAGLRSVSGPQGGQAARSKRHCHPTRAPSRRRRRADACALSWTALPGCKQRCDRLAARRHHTCIPRAHTPRLHSARARAAKPRSGRGPVFMRCSRERERRGQREEGVQLPRPQSVCACTVRFGGRFRWSAGGDPQPSAGW